MIHHKHAEQISLWLDNELSPSEIKGLQHHLAQCDACTQFYEAMKQVDHVLSNAPMAAPAPGFIQRFEARLTHHQVKQGRMWLGMTILALSTFVMLIAGGIFGWLVLSGWGTDWILPTFYTYLGRLGALVNETRAVVNLSALFFKVSLMMMQEPVFWGFVAVTLALVALWIRIVQMIYRRTPMATAMFA